MSPLITEILKFVWNNARDCCDGVSESRSQWVFGGVDLNTGDFFMEIVTSRDAATLMLE